MKLSIHKNMKRWKAVIAICVALAATCASIYQNPVTAYAYTPVAAVINDGPVQLRNAPVNGTKLALLYQGDNVTVIDETTGSDGRVWYQLQVSYNGNTLTGYTRSDFVTIQSEGGASTESTSEEDQAYVAALQAAGFPESYCSSLLELHKKYPNWQFVPVQTGLDWNTVIANESVAGRNLIQSAANDARKSTDGAAYDWATNTWYGYDGSGWVCASPEYIAYCMDPRNFLNETYIFQFETLEYASYQNEAGVSNILANTFMSGNYTDTDGATRSYAETFTGVGSSLGVSPYHLAARCKQEQGTKGTSPLISGLYSGYEGYYNYFNIGAYTTSSASATVNGLIYAKQQGWNSIFNSIAGGSTIVANNYVQKGQNTIYFEKFNVVYTDKLYSHQYMTNVQAAMSEGSNMSKAYSDKSQAFVFRIPVYQNMPASAATFTDSGNPNNWLSSITIDGYNLTPVFNGATTAYTLVVDANVESINVGATAVANTSSIAGVGNHALSYGNNTINITCTSQSGVARDYTITVARQQPAVGEAITVGEGATITSSYPISTYITGIQPGSSASDVLSGISAQGCTVKVLDANGAENTGNVGTGNRIAVYINDELVRQYEIVIYGDINGDSRISNADIVLMQKQILGLATQSGVYLEAANISRDGGISNKDLVLLQKHILDIAKINQ